jgi:TrmH family RNA methyltransferase
VTDTISSASNPRVRAAARLRDRGPRDDAGMTLVDGGRELRRALAAGVEVDEAFVCEPLLRTEDARAAVEELRASGAPILVTTEAAFAKIAFGERAEGVVAVVRTPSTELERLDLPPDPLVVVLEGVEKPGNLGAVLRSADGAGADALVLADHRTDPYNPNAIRASAGTVFTVPIGAASTPEVRDWLGRRLLRVVAARLDAAASPWDVDLTGSVAIALGAETTGLSASWSSDVTGVRLPMLGVADSLNVSVAAAVLLYEARRQRGARA